MKQKQSQMTIRQLSSLQTRKRVDYARIDMNNTSEKLTRPEKSTRNESETGYKSSAKDLQEFDSLRMMPMGISMSCLNKGSSIEETLLSNKAC